MIYYYFVIKENSMQGKSVKAYLELKKQQTQKTETKPVSKIYEEHIEKKQATNNNRENVK